MKLACEIPTANLAELNGYTDYDFIIASHCVNDEKYKQFFIDLRKEHPERESILDNGAFEEGKAIDFGIYKELIDALKPNVLVLPDVVNDMRATLKASEKFMSQYDELCNAGLYSMMGVLQGNTIKEYVECLEEFNQYDVIETIGIPYHLFYRPLFIEKNNIIDFCDRNGLEIHILGLPNPFEVVELAKYPDIIKSIDTSLPIVSGKHGKRFAASPIDWKRERLNINDVYDHDQEISAIHNITYLKWLMEEKDPFIQSTFV